MKKLLFTAGILLFSFWLFGQSTNNAHSRDLSYIIHRPGDVSISLSGNMLNNNPFDPVMAGGFKMKIFVTRKLSLDTDLLIGKDYYHFGPGIFGLPLILLSSDSDSGPALGLMGIILMIASAEHVAYHIPL